MHTTVMRAQTPGPTGAYLKTGSPFDGAGGSFGVWARSEGGPRVYSFFFFNDPATTEIYTLSLHDALPISRFPRRLLQRLPLRPHRCDLAHRARRAAGARLPHGRPGGGRDDVGASGARTGDAGPEGSGRPRSEEHTSELQSLAYLVCRLLLE